MIERVARLEEIAGRDVGHRGIAPLLAATRGDLYGAASSLAEHRAPHVAILTGFYIPAAEPPAPETDGPVGAAHLAAALERVGVPARLVTDEPCAGGVRAAARAAGLTGAIDVLGVDPDDDDIAEVLAAWDGVTHTIAVERVGPAADGVCRNARGDDISAHTAPLDRLFAAGPRVRIGIGDGGNELGMGKLAPELVRAHIPRGERIACRVGCEHLLVCGVSNWGALALVAAVALLRPDWRPALVDTLSEDLHLGILRAMVEEGPAVDGMKRRPALSVDGLEWEEQANVVRRLRGVLEP